jgi:hypothetical protein
MQVKFPECSASTESILIVLILLLIWDTVTPGMSFTNRLLNFQVIVMGKSPLVTGTLSRSHVTRIDGFFAKRKRYDLGWY